MTDQERGSYVEAPVNTEKSTENTIGDSEKSDVADSAATDSAVAEGNIIEETENGMDEHPEAAVEALLFAMGGSVSIDQICQVLDMTKKEAEKLLSEMMEKYEDPSHGIHIIRLEDSYQLATKREQYPVLIRAAKQPPKAALTDVVLETLSIIAYKQPVTRLEVEKIRGVNSDHAINRLIEYNLVKEVGRLDAPGHPILFGTTEEFLRHFGTDSLKDLPQIPEAEVDTFKHEAEEEVDQKLHI